MYKSTKTYGHEIGLSCCFRQWKADSHCNKLHGYSIGVKFTFVSEELDVRNWVVDFGSLKSVKTMLENTFDHKTIVAEDDPQITFFTEAHSRGIIDIVVVKNVGCEAFSKLIHNCVSLWLEDYGYSPRVRLESVEVMEHGANSAIFSV